MIATSSRSQTAKRQCCETGNESRLWSILKQKWEKLQKEYNDLEDDRDEHGVMVEKLRDDLKDMTVQREDLERANELLKTDNEELEANAATDKDAATEYEETCEDLNKDVSRQKRELEAPRPRRHVLQAPTPAPNQTRSKKP